MLRADFCEDEDGGDLIEDMDIAGFEGVPELSQLSFCNVRLMTRALTTKKGAKWMKGERATKVLHYLYKEADSSDDEADVSFLPRVTW